MYWQFAYPDFSGRTGGQKAGHTPLFLCLVIGGFAAIAFVSFPLIG
jgi:hypothetical protein